MPCGCMRRRLFAKHTKQYATGQHGFFSYYDTDRGFYTRNQSL